MNASKLHICGEVDEHGQTMPYPSRKLVLEIVLPTLAEVRRNDRARKLAGLPPLHGDSGMDTRVNHTKVKTETAHNVKFEESDDVAMSALHAPVLVSPLRNLVF